MIVPVSTPKDPYATIEDIAEIRLSGSLAVSHVLEKRDPNENCLLDQKLQISFAVIKAQDYAESAYHYLGLIDDDHPPRRYTTWFGTYTFLRKVIVQETFFQMVNYGFSKYTYDCSCIRTDVFAYVSAYIFQL